MSAFDYFLFEISHIFLTFRLVLKCSIRNIPGMAEGILRHHDSSWIELAQQIQGDILENLGCPGHFRRSIRLTCTSFLQHVRMVLFTTIADKTNQDACVGRHLSKHHTVPPRVLQHEES